MKLSPLKTMADIHPAGQTWKVGKIPCFNNQTTTFLGGDFPPPVFKEDKIMAFFTSAITVLQTLVVALGAGLGVWGAINLLEGYGNDNPGAKSQGMKQLMAGGGVALIGTTLIPLLSGLLTAA